MKKSLLLTGVLVSLLPVVVIAQTYGVKKKVPRPKDYGNVVINNFSEKNPEPIAPVVFNHWLHRAKYTCRFCHADLGFAMVGGATKISEEDNLAGFYCGACHNGTIAFAPEESDDVGTRTTNCHLCHSSGLKVQFKSNFYAFVKEFPRARSGNRVDWLKAEDKGFLGLLVDQIEGVSMPPESFKIKVPLDTQIMSKEVEIPDVIFSHDKHNTWTGCEVCHPEIFAIEAGATKYKMQDNFDGKFCGACHGKVAFPLSDCKKCHSVPIQEKW